MTGSGELGPIAPGWNVSEYATPVTIGDNAGGTGNVTFNAAAREESLFVVNNSITTTEENLGSVSGTVKSVSQTGINVSVSHSAPLSIFDATANIPALGAGGVVPALDLCNQISGRQILLKNPRGYFYSLRGHSAGFDSTGATAQKTINDGSYLYYNNSTGKTYPVYYREIYGSIWANNFSVIDNDVWSNYVIGDSFSNNKAVPTSRVAFKTLLQGGETVFSFTASPDDSNTGSGQTVTVALDAATETIYLTGKYRSGGILKNLEASGGFPDGVDFTKEFAVFIEYSRPVTGNIYSINIYACNTDNYELKGQIQTTYNADVSYYNRPWTVNGIVRSIYRDQGGADIPDFTIEEYETPVNYVVSGNFDINGPVPAQSKTNMWEYLQQACAAYAKEISAVDNVISVRDVGIREIDITNIAGAPTVSPNIILSGRSVEVVCTNSYNVDNQELYNAYKDNNRVISVKASEAIKTTVEIEGTPAVVYVPQRSVTPPAGVNQYCVVDSKGLQIPAELWEEYGGKLTISINPEVPNGIDITLTGPSSSDGKFNEITGNAATPLYPGPYKLAYTASGTDYAALSITGSGVRTKNQTIKILTAADQTKVAQDVAKTIKNVFISTEMQAYDRGIWASTDASGPRVTLSGSIPVTAQMTFGLVAGSRIRYRDSIYRINDVTIGNLGVNFNAVRHVTTEDFDLLWAGRSVGLHDAMWEGYDASDHLIAPLRFIGDNEPVMMFLDDDVNPYYDFDGDPEISVFPDTDFNPFYEDGGNLEGENPVYLDEDSNPYDGGEGYGS